MGRTGPKIRPVIERFWSRVNKTDTCWLWTGALGTGGYATIRLPGSRQQLRAHRWAYEYFVGPIPEGLTLDHLCRVRHCVNPAHLEPVTMRENLLRSPDTQASRKLGTHIFGPIALA